MASLARGEPVEATASQVTRWLLIEVPGTWGRDAVVQSELGAHAPPVWRQAMKRHRIRVIAIRRDLQHHRRGPDAGARVVYVEAPRPGTSAGAAHRATIADLHEVVGTTASLAAGRDLGPGWEPDPDRYVLVCTNGRHDACCATFGRPLVRALRDSPWGGEVWECSHVGGDRWAANVVILPDSLYFGHQDAASAARVLAAHDEGRLELTGFRGRSTSRLIEQAGEHHVRRVLGLDRLDAVRAIDQPDDDTVRLEVVGPDGPARCLVRLAREDVASPTPLTCKGREGLSYPAFRVLDLQVDPLPS